MNLFSQNKIGQIAYANWNLEEEKWNYHSFDSWNYDENGREELYTYQDTRFSDFTPTNNLHSFSQYDDEGKLIEKHDLHYGPNEWRNFIYRYTYDSEGRLMEEEVTSTTSQNDVQVMYKNVFEIDDDENRKSALFYYKNEAGNYFLENRKDSIFNNQNCLIEQSFFTYFENGLIRFGRKWITAFTDECEPLQIDFYRWNTGVELLVHENKEVYDYFNDGKLITLTQEEYNDNSNQWNTRQITETELNDDGLITRYFSELYRSTGIDSTLTLTTYTSKNEVETSQKYQMRNTLEGRFFQRVRNDSFAYHYNLQDQIILREDFYQFRENSIVENTIVYKYYCNGQLKSEVVNGQNPQSRKDIRYVGGVDCPLEEKDGAILLFPNPTSGRFTIQANMLGESETTIQVFTLLGQEIFSQKVNQSSYQYQLNLSNFEKGSYFVMINNSEEVLSEKVIVF